jgi:hypothetical protein
MSAASKALYNATQTKQMDQTSARLAGISKRGESNKGSGDRWFKVSNEFKVIQVKVSMYSEKQTR